jgi:hypothetical protein
LRVVELSGSSAAPRQCRKMALCQLPSCWEGGGEGVELVSGEEAEEVVRDGGATRVGVPRLPVRLQGEHPRAPRNTASATARSATTLVARPAIICPRPRAPPPMRPGPAQSNTMPAINRETPYAIRKRCLRAATQCWPALSPSAALISSATDPQSACFGLLKSGCCGMMPTSLMPGRGVLARLCRSSSPPTRVRSPLVGASGTGYGVTKSIFSLCSLIEHSSLRVHAPHQSCRAQTRCRPAHRSAHGTSGARRGGGPPHRLCCGVTSPQT